jgi:hypothetical protein
LLCSECSLPLSGGDEAALFICANCGLVYEVQERALSRFPASTAAITTELAAPAPAQYLAVWRLLPAAMPDDDPVWQLARRAAAPSAAYVYVPAFSLARAVVQRLGVRLTEVQPVLELEPGGPVTRGPRIARPDRQEEQDAGPAAPGFDTISPILVGRREAWGLAYFIHMAIEARETHDLHSADIRLEPGQEELLFIPAVWDPRHIHESNWRLLLHEFDGLVA